MPGTTTAHWASLFSWVLGDEGIMSSVFILSLICKQWRPYNPTKMLAGNEFHKVYKAQLQIHLLYSGLTERKDLHKFM